MHERRKKDRIKHKITDIVSLSPKLTRHKLIKKLRGRRKQPIQVTKEDLALHNMLKMLSKTKDKRIWRKTRSSCSYNNRSAVRSKPSTAVRNARSRQNITKKIRTRISTAKIKLNLSDINKNIEK